MQAAVQEACRVTQHGRRSSDKCAFGTGSLQSQSWMTLTQPRGGGGRGDGARGTVSAQASPPIRLDDTLLRPTIAATRLDDFSWRTLDMRTVVAPISDGDCAASFAVPMTGAGEQPGRERPHPPTADPDPRVGSGVAHVPAADETVFRDLSMGGRVRLSAEF
jgi:hypothetical protein